MGTLREVFGPSKKEIWKILCEQTGSEFVKGSFTKSDKVIAHCRDWTITLDTYVVSTGKSHTTYTRIRAPYVNSEGFRFSIYRRGIFTALGEYLGFHDIEIGSFDFDKDFVIKASNEDKVRELFSDEHLRKLMENQPRFHLQVKDDEGWFGTSFPDGVDELHFIVQGVLKDVDKLKALFELFSEVLDGLCKIGAAYEGDSGVIL